MMPQFDTFTFFSQLFWVFFSFMLLYSILCFYLLPALACTLKVRRRKLAQLTEGGSSSAVANQTNFLDKAIINNFNTTLSNLKQNTVVNNSTNNISNSLSKLLVSYESLREYKLTVTNKSLIACFLSK